MSTLIAKLSRLDQSTGRSRTWSLHLPLYTAQIFEKRPQKEAGADLCLGPPLFLNYNVHRRRRRPKAPKLPVTVSKPTPYTFDLGLLLALDPNPLAIDPANREASLAAIARDGAQVLINQLLTACPISSTPEGVLLSLPAAQTAIPREKPIPAPKTESKWAAFAKRRGIAPKTREQRRNLQYDEKTQEWGRKWGYKGANKAGQDEPIIELNLKKESERKEGTTVRGDKRREIREKIKRNERKQRANERNAGKGSR
ncbi:ribosome biogenesis regulatory protein-domain-containing protein [Bombardia bombarda]|uniref:Ribosome biogenesis regulatory protein n=1 Tax=Bombardia bombarda TaxID=252184 RepID=A0AA39WZX8_9PEZI|nr:ribosome biogenesis regulatory protein-domain-containing protein [Bombardia bombarda]